MDLEEATAETAAVEVPIEFPVGFRFAPTDEQLVMHYLRNKVLEIPFRVEFIKEINISELFRKQPKSIVPRHSGERYWYFFIPLSEEGFNQYTNEIQIVGNGKGFWKFMSDSYPFENINNQVIAMKKDLAYFKGDPTIPRKSHWTMQLFQLSKECCNNLEVDQQLVGKWCLVKIRKGKSRKLKS